MTEIKQYITNDFEAIDSQDTISDVQFFFNDLTYSHFPILDKGIYIGCISAADAESFDTLKIVGEYRYSLGIFFARPNMLWADVLEIFAKNNTNLVPVLDEKNNYLGYYEIDDIADCLRRTPFLQVAGGIITIRKKTVSYSISEICQIIESNNSNILGLFISETDNDTTSITIKIGVGAMNQIIQSFRRYEYEIISEHQDDDYIMILKERSDYLDKYLSI